MWNAPTTPMVCTCKSLWTDHHITRTNCATLCRPAVALNGPIATLYGPTATLNGPAATLHGPTAMYTLYGPTAALHGQTPYIQIWICSIHNCMDTRKHPKILRRVWYFFLHYTRKEVRPTFSNLLDAGKLQQGHKTNTAFNGQSLCACCMVWAYTLHVCMYRCGQLWVHWQLCTWASKGSGFTVPSH